MALVVNPFAFVNSGVSIGYDPFAMPLTLVDLTNIDTVLVTLDSKVSLLLYPREINHVRHYRLVTQKLLLLCVAQILFRHPFFHSFAVGVDPSFCSMRV